MIMGRYLDALKNQKRGVTPYLQNQQNIRGDATVEHLNLFHKNCD